MLRIQRSRLRPLDLLCISNNLIPTPKGVAIWLLGVTIRRVTRGTKNHIAIYLGTARFVREQLVKIGGSPPRPEDRLFVIDIAKDRPEEGICIEASPRGVHLATLTSFEGPDQDVEVVRVTCLDQDRAWSWYVALLSELGELYDYINFAGFLARACRLRIGKKMNAPDWVVCSELPAETADMIQRPFHFKEGIPPYQTTPEMIYSSPIVEKVV